MDKLKRSDTTIGSKEPTPTNLTIAFRTGGFILGDGVFAPSIDMSIFWNRLQGLNFDDQRPRSMAELSTELEEFMKLKIRFTKFSLVFVPRSENVSSDSLAKIARSFHRELYYIGCPVPVWFPRPPQT